MVDLCMCVHACTCVGSNVTHIDIHVHTSTCNTYRYTCTYLLIERLY